MHKMPFRQIGQNMRLGHNSSCNPDIIWMAMDVQSCNQSNGYLDLEPCLKAITLRLLTSSPSLTSLPALAALSALSQASFEINGAYGGIIE